MYKIFVITTDKRGEPVSSQVLEFDVLELADTAFNVLDKYQFIIPIKLW